MIGRFVLLALAIAFAVPAAAFEAPLAGPAASAQVGVRGLSAPVVEGNFLVGDATLARGLGLRWAFDTLTVGADAGVAYRPFALSGSWLQLRLVAAGGPLVSLRDGPAAGARGRFVLQLEGVFGGVRVAVGPKLEPVVVLDRTLQARVGLLGGAWLLVPLFDRFGLVASLEGGQSFGGYGGGSLAAQAFVGVSATLPELGS
jgi:hypothetical protein